MVVVTKLDSDKKTKNTNTKLILNYLLNQFVTTHFSFIFVNSNSGINLHIKAGRLEVGGGLRHMKFHEW